MATLDELHPDVVAQLEPDVRAAMAERERLSTGAAPGFGTGQALRRAVGAVTDAVPKIVNLPATLPTTVANYVTPFVQNGIAGALDAPSLVAQRNEQSIDAGGDAANGAVDAASPTEAGTSQQSVPAQRSSVPGAPAPVRPAGSGGGGYGIGAAQKMAADATTRAREANEQNFLAKKEAAQAAADLGEQKAAEQAAYTRRHMAEIAALDAQDAEDEQIRRSAVANHRDKMAQLQQKVDDSKIDFNRMFKKEDGSTDYGSSVLATLSIAFGALGQALTHGGSNGALDIINQKIERDVAEQKTAFEKSKDAVTAEGNLWQEVRQEFDDEHAAKAAAKNMLIQKHLDELKQLNNEYAAPERQILFKQTAAGLQQEKANNDQIIDQSAIANADKSIAQRMQAEGLNLQRQSVNAQSAAALAKAQGKSLPDSVKAELAKIDAAEASLDSVNKDKPNAVAAVISKVAPWDTDADKYERNSSNKITGVAKALSGEATNEADIKRNEANRPRATDTEATAEQKAKVFRDQLQERRRAILAQYGVEVPTTSLAGL